MKFKFIACEGRVYVSWCIDFSCAGWNSGFGALSEEMTEIMQGRRKEKTARWDVMQVSELGIAHACMLELGLFPMHGVGCWL